MPFADADHEIERAADLSVKEIFERFGEPYFRDGERRVIARLIDGQPKVIATGGGAFLNDETRALILDQTVAVWLDAAPAVLAARVGRRDTRPLLSGKDPLPILERLARERSAIYALAPHRVMSQQAPRSVRMAQKRAAEARVDQAKALTEDVSGHEDTSVAAAPAMRPALPEPATEANKKPLEVRCFGRTNHSYRMPHKPIKQGYKIFALAERGYVFAIAWTSKLWGIMELFKYPGLSPTASMVLNLITKLPRLPTRAEGSEKRGPEVNYSIYMDNFFTSIPLFKELRHIGCGACGTARQKASFIPKALAELKEHFTKLLIDNPLPKRRKGGASTGTSTPTQEQNRLVLTRHAAVLGLGALVQAFPYTSPPPEWLPEILATLAGRAASEAKSQKQVDLSKSRELEVCVSDTQASERTGRAFAFVIARALTSTPQNLRHKVSYDSWRLM